MNPVKLTRACILLWIVIIVACKKEQHNNPQQNNNSNVGVGNYAIPDTITPSYWQGNTNAWLVTQKQTRLRVNGSDSSVYQNGYAGFSINPTNSQYIQFIDNVGIVKINTTTLKKNFDSSNNIYSYADTVFTPDYTNVNWYVQGNNNFPSLSVMNVKAFPEFNGANNILPDSAHYNSGLTIPTNNFSQADSVTIYLQPGNSNVTFEHAYISGTNIHLTANQIFIGGFNTSVNTIVHATVILNSYSYLSKNGKIILFQKNNFYTKDIVFTN